MIRSGNSPVSLLR